MKLVLSTIEAASLDPSCLGSLSQQGTNLLGCLAVAAVADLTLQILFSGAGRRQRPAGFIVNQLAHQVAIAAINRQAGRAGAATQFLSYSVASTPAPQVLNLYCFHSISPYLN